MVLFPAPLGPTTPTRDERDSWTDTSYMEGFGAPGYVKVHLLIFMIAFVLLRMPKRIDGGGNENFTAESDKV
jgi:hypothetical protein